jgi:phosphoribosylglycinamide formyltransferase
LPCLTANSTPTAPSILVLISGSGSNLQALIDASNSPRLPGKITHVISNKKSAFGLTRAANAGIPTSYHNLVPYKKAHPDVAEARSVYDADLAKLVLEQKPDMVVCAGWMHILSLSFLEPLAAANVPIINLHPALPGMFDGARAIERAKEAFERGEISGTGVMVHYVIGEVDRGEPIVVRDVDMIQGEGLEALEERIHKVEHEAIVEGARIVLEKVVKERQ